MKKLTKTQVRKEFRKSLNKTVLLFTSNCSPSNTTWFKGLEYKGVEYNPSNYSITYKELDAHFDKFINEFAYYNCNSELGNRVHYYMEL